MKKLLFIFLILAPLFMATPAYAASRFWVGGTGTWDSSDTTHWSATTNGAGGASVPGSADTVTFDISSGGGTVTPNYDFTVTSITAGTASTTLDFSANNNSPTITSSFSDTGTATRGLKLGNGTWTLSRATTATVWNTSAVTGMTFDAASSTIVLSGNAAAGQTRTISNVGFIFNDIKISAGADSIAISSNTIVNNLDFTGFTGGWTTNANMTIAGSLTLGTGMTVPTGTGLMTMTASTTGATITTNGVVFEHPITINASILNTGGTVKLGDDLNMGATPGITRTLTVTQGTFDANNHNVTIGAFSSNNSTTRGILMGSGQWTLTGSSTTIWNTSTINGATVSGNSNPIIANYSGSGGTRTFTPSTAASGATEANAFSFNITAGSDTFAYTSARFAGSLDFTGFTGTYSVVVFNLYGSLTFSSGMTITVGNAGTCSFLATSGTKTLTSNGQTLDFPITVNAPGATVQLADNLVVGTSTAASGNNRTITLTSGTLDLNGKTLTHLGTVTNTGAVTRAVNFGSGGVWNLVATTTSTVWNASGSGFTTSGVGAIKISGASTNTKTFTGGGYTYKDLYYSNSTAGQLTIGGSNTFSDIKDDGQVAHTLAITAGTTQTTAGFHVSGTAGNLITLTSTNTSTFSLVKTGSGKVSVDYLDIAHSVATPALTWYAGTRSTNNQATATAGSGWIFTVPPYIPAKHQIIGGFIRFIGGKFIFR